MRVPAGLQQHSKQFLNTGLERNHFDNLFLMKFELVLKLESQI